MVDSHSEGWQELQTQSRRQCPKLFYQFLTKDQSLTLLLTDLIGIWETSLDEYDIKAAASRQGTTIDPSASSQQFQVLLSKIRKSLSDGENKITRGTDRNSQTLLLCTTIALPKPLKALEWTFTLNPQPTSELAERILRPSLHEVAVSGNKIASLLGIIKDKDHVISKLLDRIGTSGVDLNLVFPSIAGFASKKGGHVSVADAKKHVAGIAEFDETSWTRGFAGDDGYEGADRTGLGSLVSGCEKCFAHTKVEHESWIKDLPTKDQTHQSSKDDQDKAPPNNSNKEKPDNDDESTEDEFERQPTPPHLKPKSPSISRTKKPSTRADESTEDEGPPPSKQARPSKIGGLGKRNATKAFGVSKSPTKASPPKALASPHRRASTTSTATETASEDEDIQPSPRRRTKSPVPEPAMKSKVVAKNAQPTRSPSATPSPSPPPMPTRSRPTRTTPSVTNKKAAGEETETEDEDLNASPSPPPKPKVESKASTPAKAPRLGRLGAKKQSTPSKSATPDPDPDDKEAPARHSPPKKIGRLGGLRKKAQTREPTSSPPPTTDAPKSPRKAAGDASDATNSPSPSPSRSSKARQVTSDKQRSSSPAPPPKKPDPPPKKEESAEEAATRRRMELKRTIEAAGAGRKKRRF